MAVNNKRAVLRLAAGALSLPAAFLLGGCSLRLPQGEAAREPEPTTTMAAPPVSEEPLSEEERWQQLVQKACEITWSDGKDLDAELHRQITFFGDCGRLGYYETETVLYSEKGDPCYSLDRNTYRWQDGGSSLSYSDPYNHISCYKVNGCLYQQDSEGKHVYLDGSFFPYNVVSGHIPVDFTGEQIAGEIDGEELAGQYRIHMIVDPVDAAHKLAPYRATGNGLVTENQTVTSLTVEYHIGEDGLLRSQTLMVEGTGNLKASDDSSWPVQYRETIHIRYPAQGEALRSPVEPPDKQEYVLVE